MSKAVTFLIGVWFCCVHTVASAEEAKVESPLTIVGMDKLAASLKLAQFKTAKFDRRVKIAVFDNGFWGYDGDAGKLLPEGTPCYSNSEVPDQECKDEYKLEEQRAKDAGSELKGENKPFHGLLMASIIAQILTRAGNSNYEMALFRTNGLDRLTRAIKKVVEKQFDVVVYADVWEFGGFGDGKGFVNAAVNEALRAGVIWINSAGNFGRSMRVAPVETGADDWVRFKTEKGGVADAVTVRCTLNTSCNLRLVLSWNDFKDDPEQGSDKQLNLYLFDQKKTQVAASEKIQMKNPPADDKRYTRLPRQMILTSIEPDSKAKPKKYTIRVKNISKNFSASVDKLRIMASGLGIEVLEPSLGETILPPADNPGLIAIGASDDPGASSSRALKIPKVYLKSLIELKNGLKPFESSTAGAMAGGLTVLFLGSGTEKTRDAVEAKLMTVSQVKETSSSAPVPASPASAGGKSKESASGSRPVANLPARTVSRAPSPRYAAPVRAASARGASCLPQAAASIEDSWLREQLENTLSWGGAAMVRTGGGLAVAVYYDLGAQYGRYTPYDRYYLTANGVMVLPPDRLYILEGMQAIPLFQTVLPLCP